MPTTAARPGAPTRSGPEPGRGDVDLATALATLPADFAGWVIVEVDVPEAPSNLNLPRFPRPGSSITTDPTSSEATMTITTERGLHAPLRWPNPRGLVRGTSQLRDDVAGRSHRSISDSRAPADYARSRQKLIRRTGRSSAEPIEGFQDPDTLGLWRLLGQREDLRRLNSSWR